jgi:hypothetical protein
MKVKTMLTIETTNVPDKNAVRMFNDDKEVKIPSGKTIFTGERVRALIKMITLAPFL